MNVAVKYGALGDAPLVSPDGVLVTEGGQASVAQRLLSLYPGAVLIGDERASGDGFEIVTLADIDADETLVINLDVLDSVGIFQRLHRSGAEPKIMNFQWINPSTFHHPVNFAAMGLAYSFFPTFCSGERTAAEVREVTERWALQQLAHRAKVAWADLGVNTERLVERVATPEPVVLYPAISMDARKQPMEFLQIVTAVQKKEPIKVTARLAQSQLASGPAIKLATLRWTSVSPLRAKREDYWTELASTTAFLATSLEEAYGLQYVEALLAGVVGILPDRPWARNLVPPHYPFLYTDTAEAERMLLEAVRDPDGCRARMDAAAGGPFTEWIRTHHGQRGFEEAFKAKVAEWFGA